MNLKTFVSFVMGLWGEAFRALSVDREFSIYSLSYVKGMSWRGTITNLWVEAFRGISIEFLLSNTEVLINVSEKLVMSKLWRIGSFKVLLLIKGLFTNFEDWKMDFSPPPPAPYPSSLLRTSEDQVHPPLPDPPSPPPPVPVPPKAYSRPFVDSLSSN